MDLRFFATCPRNVEDLLASELRGLGVQDVRETSGGCSFGGTLADAYRVCLWVRVANRVLLNLLVFPTGDLGGSNLQGLYEEVQAIDWARRLDVRGTLAVDVTSAARSSALGRLNTHFAEQRVKDAIVDRMRTKSGLRPSVDLASPDLRVNVHIAASETTLSLDLAGESLHRRGYRTSGSAAPLKENLAAAVLLRAGWPRMATAGVCLVDPMCGSGTLVFEAAMIAGDIAPGLLTRRFSFLKWPQFESGPWERLVAEAEGRRSRGIKRLPPLFGYDADKRAIAEAQAEARRLGLSHAITFEARVLAELVRPAACEREHAAAREAAGPQTPAAGVAPRRPTLDPDPAGFLITNPPYGKRMGDVPELTGLYEQLGSKLRDSFGGWVAAVFTGNPELSEHLGLRAKRSNVFYNGPILCRLLVFDIHQQREPGSPLEKGTEGAPARTAGGEMFANRLRKNHRHLQRWAVREGVSCYRVYDADLPDYSVAVDLYGDWAQVQEYQAPASIDRVQARRRLKEALAIVPEELGLSRKHVVLKVRRRQRGADQYQKLRETGEFLEVEEAGLRFLVNLTDYLDTGLFLDHRPIRARIRELAAGKRFLNLFAYTGSATVFAAAGGAARTTSVDISSTYLDWARRNLELNGLAGPRHELVQADCLDWLDGAAASVRRAKQAGRYDLIFLDAPTFSNSKRMSGDFDVQQDHVDAIQKAAILLAADGLLLFSTNFRRFKLDSALQRQFAVADITRQTIPLDFGRSPRVHSCFEIRLLRAPVVTARRTSQTR